MNLFLILSLLGCYEGDTSLSVIKWQNVHPNIKFLEKLSLADNGEVVDWVDVRKPNIHCFVLNRPLAKVPNTPPPTPPRKRGGERLRQQMRGGVLYF
ncbi:hypothetical protein LC586_26165 [Nostoc sp. CHAB 5714]|uniref:Uncharacterized protein n=1 Tax=Nostoc favosum CHAB5714 TaxID=2780399 RepID=A0ABS8IFG1_9NOSO|nr:hypothetical protein [Nostoc favosum CHAB5714]